MKPICGLCGRKADYTDGVTRKFKDRKYKNPSDRKRGKDLNSITYGELTTGYKGWICKFCMEDAVQTTIAKRKKIKNKNGR